MWRTTNVTITHNEINFNPANIPGCNQTVWPTCGAGGIFSNYSSTTPYNTPGGWTIPTQITFFQNNTWSNNTYHGPSTFYAWNQGNPNPITWADWTGNPTNGNHCTSPDERTSGTCTGPFGQDTHSTYNPAPPPETPTPTPTTTSTPIPTPISTTTPEATPAVTPTPTPTPNPVPGATATTTTLKVIAVPWPFRSVGFVILIASVTPPNVTGTIQFTDGNTNLGSPVAMTNGVAIGPFTALPAGSHSLTAVLIPTNPADFAPSTSNAVTITSRSRWLSTGPVGGR